MVTDLVELTGFDGQRRSLVRSRRIFVRMRRPAAWVVEPFKSMHMREGVAAQPHSKTSSGEALVDFHGQAQLGEFTWNSQ